MSDTIRPALTSEEWEFYRVGTYDLYVMGDGEIAPIGAAPNAHALAALALHGQPFGFTREDVRVLRETDLDTYRDEYGRVVEEHPDRPLLNAISVRIEALLPPETK